MGEAAVLRKAATGLRDEWGDGGPAPMGTAWHQERDFHLAVADWLDATAQLQENIDSGIYWNSNSGWHSSKHHAITVAAAYLGGPS